MKILIPVDFSAASRQAMRYAFYIAGNTDAQIILLHVFDIPAMTADAYVFIPPHEEIEKVKDNHIIHFQQFVTRDSEVKYKNIKINYDCNYGNPSEHIIEFSKNEHVDLIIMGIQGKCVQPSYFMGSTFIQLMNHSTIPVIGLHGSTNFSALKHILFTYDLKEFHNKSVFQSIIQLSSYFKAHIHVLNVSSEISESPILLEQLMESELEPNILKENISFHIVQNIDIIEGIKEFLKTQSVELICFVPREHNILSKILKESTSRKAAFQFDLPLMSIHN